MRFALAHSDWTITGRDVVAERPEPTLGPRCMAHLKGLARWGAARPGYLAGDAHEAGRRLTCRWQMKRIVRSALETVMLEVGGYTRDIHPCAEAAASRYPAQADRLWRAAELAVAPTGDQAVAGAARGVLGLFRRLSPYFCSSVQIAEYIACASGGQAGVKRPASASSSGTLISGAVAMSSGRNASEPSMPLA